MEKDNFTTRSAPDPVGAYPHARVAGNFLYLSGVGPRSPGSNKIPGNVYDDSRALLEYDIEAQCHAVFENVISILKGCGATWDDVLDVTVFLTDMERDFLVFNRVWALYASEHQPCRTTVGVTSLPTPIAIELKCIAHRMEGF